MSKEYDLGRVVGRDATINGQNAIQLIGGNNISIEQTDGTITIGLDGELDNPHFNDKNNPHEVTTEQIGAVPVSRTVNGHSLDDNISLNANDVNAVPTNRTVNGKPLTEDISLNASDVGVNFGSSSPKMDGNAAVGTGSGYSREDHVHPHDTSKQDKLTGNMHQVVGFDENGNAVAKLMDYSLFGFQIDENESDPSKKIKYIAQNASYDPAYMDYEKDEFNYGDWGDAWFIKKLKVVMLRPDGTVSAELNPDKYSEQIHAPIGQDIVNAANNNVMVAIPTVWIRYRKINGKPTFYFSDVQLSSEFQAYAHTNANGDIIPYMYMAAYNGCKDSNGRLRSLSGKYPTGSEVVPTQIEAARANNPTGKNMWDIDVLADRQLINLLLLLIGKSTDIRSVFGKSSATEISTGTMNTKGLFWGSNADNKGVKVFGIENWWGPITRVTNGLIGKNGKLLIKMTRGTQDGSTVDDYNTTGEGYIDTGIDFSSKGTVLNGYISKMYYNSYGMIPLEFDGSSTTYFIAQLWYKNLGTNSGTFSRLGDSYGPLSTNLYYSSAQVDSNEGACLTCKPE